MEYGIWNTEYGIWNTEYGIRNTEDGILIFNKEYYLHFCIPVRQRVGIDNSPS